MGNSSDSLSPPNRLDPILWVGSVSSIRLPQFFPFQKREVEIILKTSVSEALELLKVQRFSSILVQDSGNTEAINLLVHAKNLQPLAPRVFISSDLNEEVVRNGINIAQVFRFIRWPIAESELWKQLEEILRQHSTFLSRSILLKESSSQNKQLEALTHSLEEIVEERTQFIEISHQEESEKLNRERQLVRFIKDLATLDSFEDILVMLRKEIRKFHRIGDPILVYRFDKSRTHFLSFQLGHLHQTESANYFEFPVNLQNPSSDLMRSFANHFGRPFIKTHVLPLELRLTNHLLNGSGEAILCIESSMQEKETAGFVEFINDRMRPLSMALDRVLLEHQLSMYSHRWEKTFDGMRDPIAIIDLEYNVIRANRKFNEKMVPGKCYKSFANQNSSCEGCLVQDAFKGGSTQSGQVTIHSRVYQLHSYPVVLDQKGKATNIVNQYVDVTQSRELYLRMLQSEKMGAIGMLAGNIAHELNNPLTGLRSLTQVLLKEVPAGTNLYSDLVEIEKATNRSQRIIKNLLDFSKGDEQPLEEISVDEIIERTLPMLKSALRSHRLEVDLQTMSFMVYVESHLLQQVVFNIINNACQAMKEPGSVRIKSWEHQQSVFLTIEDTGPGIDLANEKKIFEPFFTTKKEGHGTGLGLSMSKSIVEKFGGKITVSSATPHGAIFQIVLPTKS